MRHVKGLLSTSHNSTVVDELPDEIHRKHIGNLKNLLKYLEVSKSTYNHVESIQSNPSTV